MGRKLVPYLPDELLLNCFARVSRLYYPSLSLVSKRFRSLLASKELYKTRKLLGTTESCLYLDLTSESEFDYDSESEFDYDYDYDSESYSYTYRSLFAMCCRPTPPILSCCFPRQNLLVLVPTDHKLFPRWKRWGVLTPVGSDIYMIGQDIYEPSTRVFVLDCMSHTWHVAPSMRIARMSPFVIVINEIIYVIERSRKGLSQDVIEFFDTKTKIWETMPSPGREIGITGSSAINGNLYLFGNKKNMVYKVKENKWDVVGPEERLSGGSLSTCVIDNVEYGYKGRKLFWWDSKTKLWMDLKGCERLPSEEKLLHDYVRLVNYGGKIALFWEKNVLFQEKEIWCTEVTLEKNNNEQEICGKVTSHNAIRTTPWSSSLWDLIVSTF